MTAAPMVLQCEHGSAEWKRARVGLVTASRCADMLATIKKKGEEAAARRNYRAELISEILTGRAVERYVTPEMRWGVAHEKFARAAYEVYSNTLVEVPGFIMHPTVDRFGCTPDAVVGDLGLAQLKCPNTSTHLDWILADTIPIEHAPQLLAELSCTGRAWVDFVSFDPRLPSYLQLFVKRYYREEDLITQLNCEVMRFNAEIDERIAQLPGKVF